MIGHGRRLWSAVAALALVAASGCQSMQNRRLARAAEPSLADPTLEGEAVIVSPPEVVAGETLADRHPLFAKPREMYENSESNKFVRTTRAIVLGVPMGIAGEIRQIVVGTPRAPVAAAPYAPTSARARARAE